MVRSWRVAVVGLAALFVMACSDDDPRQSPNVIDGNNGTSTNNATTNNTTGNGGTNADNDAGNAATNGDIEPDMGDDEEDLGPVNMAGFMHGEWQVQRTDGSSLAELRIRHEMGERMLSGTYQMQEPEPASGRLGGTQWIDEEFETSWTVEIDDVNERFALADCSRENGDSEDVLNCRFSDSFNGTRIDANLVRQ